MTEDEAKDKLCPFTVFGGQVYQCKASKCMAWYWDWDQQEHSYVLDQSTYPATWVKPEGEGWVRGLGNGWHREKPRKTGGCSLAARCEAE
jgi:hypothetical protein